MGRKEAANWLRTIRRERKLTHKQLAKRTGLDDYRLWLVEQGSPPTLDEVLALCAGVSISIVHIHMDMDRRCTLRLVDEGKYWEFFVQVG